MQQTSTVYEIWQKLAHKEPVVISGPCSAETEDQVLETAVRLAATGKVDLLRAGIWKPRTQPGNFEGVGAVGLPWLKKAKELTGLPFAVEVANAGHVEDALKFQTDVLWIGARTTTNPFSVQEIADALRGVDIPVLIKNPINPDLQLWIGAIQRIREAGIKEIAVIHRGFSSFGNTEFRNAPMWHIPIKLKSLMPDLPILCDPSHICGKRETLQEVSQIAADLDYNGLMLETHINPDKAWSDSEQQITPERLKEILSSIVWRHETLPETEYLRKLNEFREQINIIDDEILVLLANRMKISENIGAYKKEKEITILQTERWREMVGKAVEKGAKHGLSPDFIERLLEAVHIESIAHQNKVMNKNKF